jgi:pimeloyl-ACP methyl ester carboxylesterase
MIPRRLSSGIDVYRIWYKITFQRGRILSTDPEAWRRYSDPAVFSSAAAFFSCDAQPPSVRVSEEPVRAGARVQRLEFASRRPLSFPETNRAVGHLYTPLERPAAPVVVLSHGWAHRGRRGIERLYVRPLLRRKLAVLLPAHPLHYERTPQGAYSGEMMVSGDAALTVEAFRQAVTDANAAVNYLIASGRRRWGLFGYSLGGYIAGLLAAARQDAAFLVIAGCGDSVMSPILETRLGRNVREDLSHSGLLDRRKLELFWGTISPSRWTPAVPLDRILLIAGRYDRIMLPASVERLWRAWNRPAIRWLPRGHYTLLAAPGALMRQALPFMERRFEGEFEAARAREGDEAGARPQVGGKGERNGEIVAPSETA